jgi:hypothetical protein
MGLRAGYAQVSSEPHTSIKANIRLAKTLLLCNAKTVDLYRREFQPTQKGSIGITLVCYLIKTKLIVECGLD